MSELTVDDLIAPGELEALFEDGHEPVVFGGVEFPPGTPEVVMESVSSITRNPWVLTRTFHAADEKLLRRVADKTPEVRSGKWLRKFEPAVADETMAWLLRVRNRVLSETHLANVCDHRTFVAVPNFLTCFRPQGGAFTVDDPNALNPSVGHPAFLEQTPPMVVRWVYETWKATSPVALDGDDIDLDTHDLKPGVWDLTGGSGTVSDLLGRILECSVAASDLTQAYGDVLKLDAGEIGRTYSHRPIAVGTLSDPEVSIPSPDLVFFDPPSRGRPTHTEVYKGELPAQDLASLARTEWIETVAGISKKALRRLARGGYLSLLVRAGTRDRARITADPEVVEDLLEAIGKGARVKHRGEVEFRGRRNQVSLAKARVPATHLLLERSS